MDTRPAGTHQVRAEFACDGGIGRGGTVTLYVDRAAVADGKVGRTHPLYCSLVDPEEHLAAVLRHQ